MDAQDPAVARTEIAGIGIPREWAPQTPSPYFLSGEDALQLDVLGSQSLTYTVSGVMLSRTLELIPFSFSFSPSTARNVTSTLRTSIGWGWLLHVQVVDSRGSSESALTFVWLRICRGTTPNAVILGTIASGYCTARQPLYWPNGIVQTATDGQGAMVVESQANPAAGADWTFAVPAGAFYRLVAVSAILTTSAVVANRQVRLLLDDGVNVYYVAPMVVNQTAGIAWRNSWGEALGGSISADPSTVSSGLPSDNDMMSAFRVRTLTGNIDVGDQWSAIRLFFRERINAMGAS